LLVNGNGIISCAFIEYVMKPNDIGGAAEEYRGKYRAKWE
jgi:hypothetical protein